MNFKYSNSSCILNYTCTTDSKPEKSKKNIQKHLNGVSGDDEPMVKLLGNATDNSETYQQSHREVLKLYLEFITFKFYN